ncbi:hypothetical protein [Enhygromyxa salina]|uniref:Uncharacterized protein n=1 Tax=Enhygromyxa salina TaxID=215803 RepID=A0A2S9XL64_9BACT|nr:hypothetical protein [Enhygromyxa salina]PRP93628.1 hypothetical protein ENSA7_80560 [Enhygromyxa salina]
MSNIFERASRLRIRFESSKGLLTMEDLWVLPLTSEGGKSKVNLDEIARGLHREIQAAGEVSFVKPASEPEERLSVAFEVVKHVISVLMAERDAAVLEAERQEKKKLILAALAEAENKDLTSGSIDELRAKLAAL